MLHSHFSFRDGAEKVFAVLPHPSPHQLYATFLQFRALLLKRQKTKSVMNNINAWLVNNSQRQQ